MSEAKANQVLDLRGVACPNNFVKTKLKLEDMSVGEILEITIDEGEPIKNVPRAVKEDGHKIIKAEKINSHWKILIVKL